MQCLQTYFIFSKPILNEVVWEFTYFDLAEVTLTIFPREAYAFMRYITPGKN